MAGNERQIQHKVHRICREFELTLQFSWDPNHYVVVDKRQPDEWRYITDEADIRGIYRQLQDKIDRLA